MPKRRAKSDFQSDSCLSEFDLQTAQIPSCRDVLVEVYALPAQGPVALMTDDAAVAAGPLVRGAGPPFVARQGRRLSEPEDMRKHLSGVIGPAGHLERWSEQNPHAHAIAVTGCGNLGMNPGVQAWRSGSSSVWGASGDYEHRLVSNGKGRGLLQPRSEVLANSVLPGDQGWAISGPTLVQDSQVALSAAECFADPRHVLLFPYLEVKSGVWADFGCDALLRDKRLYRAAVAGEVVRLPLQEWLPISDAVEAPLAPESISPSALAKALDFKGYALTRYPGGRGTYAIEGRHLLVSFLPGIYPHHVLALNDEGSLCSILVTGLSNRAGVELGALAESLVKGGFRDAILLDNGGDVGLFDARTREFVVRPAEPDRRDFWPVTACIVFAQS